MVLKSYRVVPHIAIRDSDVVFVGYGINAPERGWNDYAGLDVKGKTVVILYPRDKWILMILEAAGVCEVRNLGDVRWVATEDGSIGPGIGKHIACFILRAAL